MTRRVLVARLDSAGDVLVSGPAIRAVAAQPDVEVTVLAGPQGAAAARLLPGVDRVITWAAPWIVDPAPAVSAAHVDELLALVADVDPDEAVILTSFHQSPLPLALVLRLAGVSRITGASVDYAGSLLDVRLRPGETLDEDQPEPERAVRIVEAAGFAPPPGDDGRLGVEPDASAIATAAELLSQAVGDAPFVVVHPGAAVPSRAWSADRNRETVEALTAAGWAVVVTGSAAEAPLARTVAGRVGVDLSGRTDLGVLAVVLERAAAVVTGNTGPAHLAAAVGTPVVSLFSPVVPASRWAPYGVPLALLGDQSAACRGSRARECPVPGHPCLTGVAADDVVEALTRLAGGPGGGDRVQHTGRAGCDDVDEPTRASSAPTPPSHPETAGAARPTASEEAAR